MQACHLSPLLFMIYLKEGKKDQRKVNWATRFRYMEEGKTVRQKSPSRMYADEIMLLTRNRGEVQTFIGIGGVERNALGFKFR